MKYPAITWLLLLFLSVHCQKCPQNWADFATSCYKFTLMTPKTRDGARESCRAYNADLVSVNTLKEHLFIIDWLRTNDPQHRRWYTSGRDQGENVWVWDGDGTQFSNTDALWLDMAEIGYEKFAIYNYSEPSSRWGLQKSSPDEELAFICEIKKEDLHQIVILERGIDYGVLEPNKDRIPQGPYFIQQPKEAIFDVGGRLQVNYISLRCVAGGYPPPTYKWFKEEYENGKAVNRLIDPLQSKNYTQTDGTLTIHEPQQNVNKGKYHCTATNKFGTIISETVQLSFGFISEFTKKRSPDYGKEYWGKSISCDPPQHYPRVKFFWTLNSFPNFVQEDRRVFVSMDGNLYFSSLEKIDRANYSCNVQNSISSTGRVGPFFPLEVEPASSGQKLIFPNNFPKAFPEAPLAGEDVRLECVAYGYPVPFYNWTRKGGIATQLPPNARTENYNRVLVLSKVRVEDSGQYECTASIGTDRINKTVTLSIQAYPVFTIPLGNKVMDQGGKLAWTCEAFGIPPVTYKWLKNGEELVPTELRPEDINRYRIDKNVLTIEDLLPSDEGMYQCKAVSELGSTYTSGQLRVLTMKPSFAKYPLEAEMYAAEGGSIVIPCKPEAAPFPKFTWKRNNMVLSPGGRIKLLSTGYLQINPVERQDEGRYTCFAKNEYGSDQSEGLLIVLPHPRLVESLSPKISAQVNDSIELQCQALVNDVLDLAYIWLHNGLRIDFKNRPQFSVGRYPGYLRIRNITFAEAGDYQCVVKTSVSRTVSRTTLLVVGPPGAPGAVTAEELTATSAVINWSDGSDNGRRITSYNIEGRTNHNKAWTTLAKDVTDWKMLPKTGRKQVYLNGVLSPWSTYEFRVSARNEFGLGLPSDPSPQYYTLMDRPHVAPSNVGGGGGNTGSLTITWDPLPPQEWNADEIWYKIYYKPFGSDMDFWYKDLRTLGNIPLYAVSVGEENYYRQYVVKVQAINPIGEGPESKEEIIYSAEGMPQDQPTQVRALKYNSTALNITWAPMDLSREKIRGKLIGHRIRYWRNGVNPEQDSLILLNRGTQPWGLIVGLAPNTEYFVSVMAYNDAGSGPETDPVLERTHKAAPLRPPSTVKVKPLSATSILVKWRGVLPSNEEEPLTGYKVRYWESDQPMTTAKEVIKYLDGGDLEAVVSDLVPGKRYKLRVLAFSPGGDGKMSSPPWEFRVGEGVPSAYVSSAHSSFSQQTSGFICLCIVCITSFVLNRMCT